MDKEKTKGPLKQKKKLMDKKCKYKNLYHYFWVQNLL